MNKKFRTAGILAAILLALGGLATWDEWKTKQEKADEQTKNKVATFKAEDVIELDYASKGGAAEDAEAKPEGKPEAKAIPVQVSAVKKDGVWRLTKPVDVLADSATIDALIKTVLDYSYSKVITEKREQWGEYGLLEPERHVTLRVGGDTPRAFTLYVGNKAPVGYNVYLRTSQDDKVLMGSQHLLVSTSKSLNDFRDKTLLKIDEAKLKSLTYQKQGAPLIEVTRADNKYLLTKPEKLDADGTAIKDFIDGLNSIRVTSFNDAPDDALKALFTKPEYEMTWQHETGEASTLKVVEKDGKLLAAFDPAKSVFGLPDEFKGKLKKDTTDFRNRRILEPDALDAKVVEIDGESFRNIEGNWYATADAEKFDDKGKFKGADKDKPQEKAHIRAFVVDLEFAKTDSFIGFDDPLVKGLSGAPEHRIKLSYHDPNKQPVTIELFKADGTTDKYLVRRSGANYVFRVAKSAFNSMTPSKEGAPAAGPKPEAGDEDGLNLEGLDGKENSGLEQPTTDTKKG